MLQIGISIPQEEQEIWIFLQLDASAGLSQYQNGILLENSTMIEWDS